MIFPTTRLGRWSVGLSGSGLSIFLLNILLLRRLVTVVNTNAGQAIEGNINDTFWTQLPIYAVFALLIVGGVLAVTAITKRDRAFLNWLAGFIGLIALWIFIGGVIIKS